MKQGKKTNAQIVQMLERKHNLVVNALERDKRRNEALGGVLSELNSQMKKYTEYKEKALREASVASESVSKNREELEKSQKELNLIIGLIERLNNEFNETKKDKEELEILFNERVKEINSTVEDVRNKASKDIDDIKKSLNKKIDELGRANEKIMIKDIEIESKANQMKTLNGNILNMNKLLLEKEEELVKYVEKIEEAKKNKLEFKLLEQKLKSLKKELKEERRNKNK